MTKVKCIYCEQEFEAKTLKGKYCSNSCKQKGKREREKEDKQISAELNFRLNSNMHEQIAALKNELAQTVEANKIGIWSLENLHKSRTDDWERKRVAQELTITKLTTEAEVLRNRIKSQNDELAEKREVLHSKDREISELRAEIRRLEKDSERKKSESGTTENRRAKSEKSEQFLGFSIRTWLSIVLVFGVLAFLFGFRKTDVEKATKKMSPEELRNLFNKARQNAGV